MSCLAPNFERKDTFGNRHRFLCSHTCILQFLSKINSFDKNITNSYGNIQISTHTWLSDTHICSMVVDCTNGNAQNLLPLPMRLAARVLTIIKHLSVIRFSSIYLTIQQKIHIYIQIQ